MRIESSALNISPKPETLYWHRDVEDNSVAIVSFNTPASQLKIESEVIIQQYNQAPLDFLVDADFIEYPFGYHENDKEILLPYMLITKQSMVDAFFNWCKGLWHTDERIQTYALLSRINDQIHNRFLYQRREEPGVQSIDETLAKGSGCCRDFTYLFMETARYFGFASRFVSGYLLTPPSNENYGATHAWPEVYLPGSGWKGFDSTVGNIVGSDHIAVAVAKAPDTVSPVSGTFTGSAKADLEVGVWVSELQAN